MVSNRLRGFTNREAALQRRLFGPLGGAEETTFLRLQRSEPSLSTARPSQAGDACPWNRLDDEFDPPVQGTTMGIVITIGIAVWRDRLVFAMPLSVDAAQRKAALGYQPAFDGIGAAL